MRRKKSAPSKTERHAATPDAQYDKQTAATERRAVATRTQPAGRSHPHFTKENFRSAGRLVVAGVMIRFVWCRVQTYACQVREVKWFSFALGLCSFAYDRSVRFLSTLQREIPRKLESRRRVLFAAVQAEGATP